MSRAAPVRLLVDATPLVPERLTGVGRVLLETLRALDEASFEDRVRVIAFVPRDERAALARYGFRRIRVATIPLPHRVVGLMARLPIAPPLDLFLGRGVYFFPNFRNWPLARSRSITFVHDVAYAMRPEFVPEQRRGFLNRYLPRWLRRTDLVVTGTPSSAAEIVSALGIPAARVAVLPTTVDATFFRPRSTDEVDAVTTAHGLGRYLLFVGSIESRKNLVTLVRAYTLAERPLGHTLFLVGGDGWDNADVHAAIDRARASGADVRLPQQYVPDADLPALMTGADALALVSWHEGFGLPALEAIACGTPVIVSDIPGLRDAVRHAPDAAVLVDPADEAGLSAAIAAAIRAPRRVAEAHIAPWSDAAEALVTQAERLG